MKAILLVALCAFASSAGAAEYIVKYRNSRGLAAIENMAAQKSNGLEILDRHGPGSYVVVDVESAGEDEAITGLMADSNIEWMHENGQVRAFAAPLDEPRLKIQWALTNVNAEKAWARAGNKGNRNVVVAVIDTGVDYRHKSLAPNMIEGFDFIGNTTDAMDVTGRANPGHGTHCAGVVGATGLVSAGTIGLSPQVSIMPIRFLGPNGSGDFNNAVKSIDFAIEKGVDVISASWGAALAKSKVTALVEAVKRASDKGIVFVVAAANDSKNNDVREVYPANADFGSTISVAASTSKDKKASFSNYGKSTVHIAAPGEGIVSTVPEDKYMEMSGTSMATPLVAGVVALLKAQDPSLTAPQIRALIQTTGTAVEIETACNCRIDAFAAVDHVLSKKPWVVPAAGTFESGSELALSTMNMSGALKFTSSNPEVMTVSESGTVTMVKAGVARIQVADAKGQTASTLDFIVKGAQDSVEDCPYSERTCKLTCRLFPSRPYCKK